MEKIKIPKLTSNSLLVEFNKDFGGYMEIFELDGDNSREFLNRVQIDFSDFKKINKNLNRFIKEKK